MEVKHKFILLGISALMLGSAGSAIGLAFSLSKDDEPAKTSEEKKESKDAQPQTEMQLVDEFEKRLTTYNAKDYPIPKGNISRIASTSECNKGLGGTSAGLGKGIFDESLYVIMTEASDFNGIPAYAPYSRVTNVINDVIFEADVDTFNRRVLNQRYLMSGVPSQRHLITPDGYYTDSYSHMPVGQYGYPVGYLIEQSGLYTGTAAFNDKCDKTLAKRKYKWQKIDISGKDVSFITQTIPVTETVVSAYGLFNFTTNSYLFLQKSTGDYIQSNLKQSAKLNRYGKFPKGSYLYVPSNIEVFKELMLQDLNEYTAIENFDMEAYKEEVAKANNINVKMVSMEESSDGENVLYVPKHKVDRVELSLSSPIYKFKGKHYMMNWVLPNTTEVNYKKGVGDLVYMNQTAHDHAVRAMKGALQGQQLTQGTLLEGDTQETARARQSLRDQKNKQLEKMFGPEYKDIPVEMLSELKDPSKGMTIKGK